MHDATLASPSLRAGRREWIGLAVLALPTLLVALDIGALFLALPHLSADLKVAGIGSLIFVALILLVVVTMRRAGAAAAEAAMKAKAPSAARLDGEESMAFPAGLVPTGPDEAGLVRKDH